MKRYVTYDIKEGNDYDALYDYFEDVGAKRLTESTYEVISKLDLSSFCEKLKSLTAAGDRVVVISVNEEGKLFHRKAR